MKRKVKNNKGITLITLVVTVIVIGILASVATYSGIEVINSSKLTRFTTEMKLIQTKVNEIYEDRNDEEYEEIGTTEELNKLSTILSSLNSEWSYGSSDTNKYKYFSQNEIKNKLNIEDVQQEGIFIDFDNRKVVSSNGITVDGKTYYVLEQLPNSLYNVEYNKDEISKVSNYVDKNVEITDKYGNQFVVPEGFKVVVDDDTNNANAVNEGIVIEDKKGNQFVWVPVGTFNVDSVGSTTETVELGRYYFEENGEATSRNDTDFEEQKKNNSKNYRKFNSKRY